jgi:hypothetical protein
MTDNKLREEIAKSIYEENLKHTIRVPESKPLPKWEDLDKQYDGLQSYFIRLKQRYLEQANHILDLISSQPVEDLELTEDEIIGDFCESCDYILEGCIEHGQQTTCKSYQEALRQKELVAKAQLSKATPIINVQRAEIDKYKGALEADATDLWKITGAIKKEVKEHWWITEGCGSYTHDDERYRQETQWAFEAILKLIENIQHPAQRRFYEVADNEILELKSEINALKAENEELKEHREEIH